MPSPISKERSDLPSPKRLKVEETTCCEDCVMDDCDSDEYDEAFDSFKEDIEKSQRQKVEETSRYEFYDSDDCDSDEYDEAADKFSEEIAKSQGYEIDFSKFKYTFGWRPLDLDDTTFTDETQTNRDLMVICAKEALSKHNVDQDKCLELDKIIRANFHPSSGITYYISFLVKDLCDGNETKPYRAMVQHHITRDIIVHSCNPKPPSSS